jgi:imidazolonepropionase
VEVIQFDCHQTIEQEVMMLIHSASQVVSPVGGPQRGRDLGKLRIVENGAILVRSGQIIEVGKSADLLGKYPAEDRWDAAGKVLLPGFVDPHTHAVWAGDRALEFESRLAGKSYLEILEAGGGILSTVRETRQASLQDLKDQTRRRIHSMLSYGTTTLEAKSGYGLDEETERKCLQALLDLDEEEPADIVITYLGAHAVPPEFKGDADGYTDLLCEELLPSLTEWWPMQTDKPLPFVDVFCERGAFNLEQSRRILEKARELGFPIKIHADEFENLGGAKLAAELGAASADHLVVTSREDIQALGASNTVAVALPCTPFGLAEPEYTPAQEILEADGILAIASDLNPGTAWCESMQFAAALACRYLKLTPAQALAAATINAAAAIGLDAKVGSLDPGKDADIIALDVPDFRHLGYRFGSNLVSEVIKKGKFVFEEEAM